jgi:redox-sensitive bicupin YhaK (pirin superfamily)
LYLFVIEGVVQTEGQSLKRRDALGIYEAEKVKMEALENAQLLAIEVPFLG